MFIELTDHLRCPEPHEEAFLVLLPTYMEGRTVREGDLGCPVCGKTMSIEGGIVGLGPRGPAGQAGPLSPEEAHTLLGVTGPGGYLALIGAAARLGAGLAALCPGIHLVLVNPEPEPGPMSVASVVCSPRLPLKTSSMRGVILGDGLPPEWIREGVRATLPGLRIVGEGAAPQEDETLEIVASTDRVWVGCRRAEGQPRPTESL